MGKLDCGLVTPQEHPAPGVTSSCPLSATAGSPASLTKPGTGASRRCVDLRRATVDKG